LTKTGKNVPNSLNITKWLLNIPNDQKYTNIFHSKALQNLPKVGFFGLKNVPSGNPACRFHGKNV
jgi:hypothetical protein